MNPDLTIRALHKALVAALVRRADGSRHHRACYEARVNSARYPCSPACTAANRALRLAEAWAAGSEHLEAAS